MRKIIVLSGKQFSGKDTVAKVIIECLSNFKRIGIADAIKLMYGKEKNLSFEEIEANKHLYRPDLIVLGNKGRSIDPDYWLKKILEIDYDIIVPDIRVEHEAEIFKNAGAYLIRVEAAIEARKTRGTIVNEHDSTECALDGYKNWNYTIDNSLDMEALKLATKPMLEDIKTFFNS